MQKKSIINKRSKAYLILCTGSVLLACFSVWPQVSILLSMFDRFFLFKILIFLLFMDFFFALIVT